MEARLEQSRNSLEPIIQSYDLARLRLSDSETRLTLATAEMNDARHNLVAARSDLAHALRAQYEQPQPDAAAVLLGAGSISQALDEMALYNRTRGFFGRTVKAIGTWKTAITAQHRIVLAADDAPARWRSRSCGSRRARSIARSRATGGCCAG